MAGTTSATPAPVTKDGTNNRYFTAAAPAAATTAGDAEASAPAAQPNSSRTAAQVPPHSCISPWEAELQEVEAHPGNPECWLLYALKHLSGAGCDAISSGRQFKEGPLNAAIQVLKTGLEAMPHCVPLWMVYVELMQQANAMKGAHDGIGIWVCGMWRSVVVISGGDILMLAVDGKVDFLVHAMMPSRSCCAGMSVAAVTRKAQELRPHHYRLWMAGVRTAPNTAELEGLVNKGIAGIAMRTAPGMLVPVLPCLQMLRFALVQQCGRTALLVCAEFLAAHDPCVLGKRTP